MNKFWIVLSFFTGLAVGSIATYRIMKVSHEQLLQEEIDSIKEEYSRDRFNTPADGEFGAIDEEINDLVDKEIEQNYRKYANSYVNDSDSEDGIDPSPFSDIQLIAPEEYGEDEGYDRKELHYDVTTGKLLTSDGEEVEDVDSLIGPAALSTFGFYEDDAVHVKNNTLKCYYEILKTV